MKVLDQQLNIKSKRKTNESKPKTFIVFRFVKAAIKAYINIIAKGTKTSVIDWSRKI